MTQFVAKINGVTTICDFTVIGEDMRNLSYSEAVQCFQLIYELYDSEMKEMILSEMVTKEIKLNVIIKMANTI